jgi:hypothetical protein
MHKISIYTENVCQSQQRDLIPLARVALQVPPIPHFNTFRDKFTRDTSFGDMDINLTSPTECDFLLFPINYDAKLNASCFDMIKKLEFLSRLYDKPVVIHHFGNDLTRPDELKIPFSNALYLSLSLLRSRLQPNHFALPYFIPDCRENYCRGWDIALPNSRRPTVGFCGIAAPIRTSWNLTKVFDVLRVVLSYTAELGIDPEALALNCETNLKHAFRYRLVKNFAKRREICTDFVFRSRSAFENNDYTNKADDDDFNTVFYRNLFYNIYNICCRGTENYSIRFYETLCMGRIPVLVDSDIVLPFDTKIDYSKHCVFIHKKELHRAAQILLDFHNSKGDDEIKELQLANRQLWEHVLSQKSFYVKLVELIKKNEFSRNDTFTYKESGTTSKADRQLQYFKQSY